LGFRPGPYDPPQAEQTAEKVKFFVIPSEARNLSSIQVHQEERFLGGTRRLGMTKPDFFRGL